MFLYGFGPVIAFFNKINYIIEMKEWIPLAFLFNRNDDDILMIFADSSFDFPLTDSGFHIDYCGELINAHTVLNDTSAVSFVCSFSPGLMSPLDVFVERASVSLISEKVLIDPLIADNLHP